MNTVMNYESIFERYGGIMRTCELTREGISYQVLQNLIEQGRVEKIKYGYYQCQLRCIMVIRIVCQESGI